MNARQMYRQAHRLARIERRALATETWGVMQYCKRELGAIYQAAPRIAQAARNSVR